MKKYIKIALGIILGGLVVFLWCQFYEKAENKILVPPVPPPFDLSQVQNLVQLNQPTYDASLNHTLVIPNTPISISVPKNYSLGKGKSDGDGGINYTRYGFINGEKSGVVQLEHITVWTGESDNLYFEICTDQTWCKNKGEQIPVLNNYYFEKKAFEERKDYQDFKYHPFENQAMFIRDKKCVDGDCVEREYSVFVKNMRIATVVTAKTFSELPSADLLYSGIYISEK